jgi:photosystem II stability/assembly factor-like uncharacterized protein
MQTEISKKGRKRKNENLNFLLALFFFLSLSFISFSLISCGGGGGGGGDYLPSSAGTGTVTSALFSGWEMTNGPFSGMVYSLAVDPNNSQIVYAALEGGGLFRGRQGGKDWERVGDELTSISVSAVDVHVDNQTIYVGTGSDGVYRSLDGGKSWTQASNLLPIDPNTDDYYEIFGITIDPTDANTVYALSGDSWYLCRTTDGGDSWTRIDGGGLPWDRIEAFAIHPENNQWLYVGMYANGVYKSEDMGASWNSINGDPANGGFPTYVVNFPCLTIDPDNDILYAGSRDYGLWKTKDDGINWEFIEVGPNTVIENWDVYVLAMEPIDKSVIYTYVETVLPVQPEDEGMYRTFDGGDIWEKVPFHEYPDTYRPVRQIAIAPSDGNVVYVSTQGEGLFMTSDVTNVASVDDWQSIDNGLVDLPVYAMIVHPWDNKMVYAGTPKGFFKTTNGGLTWEGKGLKDETVFALVTDPMDSNIIYAATDSGVYKTTNGGDTWSGEPSGLWFYSLAIGRDPLNPDANILYGGSPAGMGIYRAEEDDVSNPNPPTLWEPKDTGLTADEKYVHCLAIDPTDPSILYAGTGYRRMPGPETAGKVVKTTDGGNTWPDNQKWSIGEPVCSLSIDPYNPQILYAGTYVGFYASSDGGDTWEFRGKGLGQRFVRSIAIDPMDSKKVCAGTYEDGVFASINGGKNWTRINQGLPGDLNKRICSLVMDISDMDNPVIYAGTGCGVFKAYK